MQFSDEGIADDLGGVRGSDATPSHDHEAVSRLLDEGTDELRAGERVPRLPRSQQPRHPEGDELLQNLERVTADIEGAVKGHGKRVGGLHQPGHLGKCERTVFAEDAKDEAIGSSFLEERDVLEHDRQLGTRIAKVPATRADEDVNRDFGLFPCRLEEPQARRDPAFSEGATQLGAVRARLFSSAHPRDIFGTDLES